MAKLKPILTGDSLYVRTQGTGYAPASESHRKLSGRGTRLGVFKKGGFKAGFGGSR